VHRQAIVSLGGQDLTVLKGRVSGWQDPWRLNETVREFNDALKDVRGRIIDTKYGMRALIARG